jgi:hypothetical protein
MNSTIKNMPAGDLLVGDTTTCQFGNPMDCDWTGATHAHQPVKVLDMKLDTLTKKVVYLVSKVSDPKYVGRATDPRGTENEEIVRGTLYCTNARLVTYDIGAETIEDAKRSLGF